MASYSDMAKFYDILTDDVIYEKWADYFERLFIKYSQKPEIILDLACGTGSLSCVMAQRGYEVIGADASPEMLSAAAAKIDGMSKPPMFICQRMETLDLYGTVDCALCCLDSVNYLKGTDMLNTAFKRTGLFIKPGGLFIFDINTERKFKEMHLQSYIREKGNVFCAWQAEYNEKKKTADFKLDFFEHTEGCKYKRFTEHHTEHVFSIEELECALKLGEMKILDIFGELKLRHARAEDERIFIVAEKQ